MLQHLIIHFSLYYLLNGRLREVKNRRKFPTFSSKSGRGRFTRGSRLQDVPNIVIWLGNVWYFELLYGSVSQGLGTTKSTNLIGWNGYWPWSRFSHLDRHLDRKCFEVKKLQTEMKNHRLFSSNNIYSCQWQKADEKKKIKRTSKIWKNEIRLVAVRNRNVT